MGHKNGQLGMCENMAGSSSEDHLSKAALSVSTLEEKIRA
jgi:hypothetical protein